MFAFKIFLRSYPHKYPIDFFGQDMYLRKEKCDNPVNLQ